MVLVRQPVVEDWQALRDIRLEALRDAPSAFGSTYEREVVRGETHWRDRISRGGTFLAYLPDHSYGYAEQVFWYGCPGAFAVH